MRPTHGEHYLSYLGRLNDYWLEVGSKRSSSDTLKARAKHLLDWIEQEDREDMTCAMLDDTVADAFRTWSQEQLIVYPSGKTKKRALATTEESLNYLKAVLWHAKEKGRTTSSPDFKTKQRKEVSAPILTRLSLEQIAGMLAYAAAPHKKRKALHAFLVASVCTLARPDAVFDISVDPCRRQWKPADHLLRLNPHGRPQTKKRRPHVVVPPQLATWLQATHDDPDTNGWLVNYGGEPVSDVDSSWDRMLVALGLPVDNEHKSYVVRRSMATILRNWHHNGGTLVDYRELQEQMGHEEQTTTDVYASKEASAKMTVQIALREVLDKLEKLAPGAFHRKNTGAAEAGLQEAA